MMYLKFVGFPSTWQLLCFNTCLNTFLSVEGAGSICAKYGPVAMQGPSTSHILSVPGMGSFA